MTTVIDMAAHIAERVDSTAEHNNTSATPDDLATNIALEALLEEHDERYGWMKNATAVPPHLTTGNIVTDALGIANALNSAGRENSDSIEVFKLTMEFFNKLLKPLDEGEREAVLNTLDQNTARALLMLDYSEKLKVAELVPMVDAALRARSGAA